MKKLHARELSRNQPILHFDVILQHDWPIEQCLLHVRVSLAGKRRGHVLSFHPLADETKNEHLPKPFFKVIRKSLYCLENIDFGHFLDLKSKTNDITILIFS